MPIVNSLRPYCEVAREGEEDLDASDQSAELRMTLRTMTGKTQSPFYRPRDFPDGRTAAVTAGRNFLVATVHTSKKKPMLLEQKRTVSALALTLGSEATVHYDPVDLTTLYETASKFSAPIFATAILKIADSVDSAGGSFTSLCLRTGELFSEMFRVVYHGTPRSSVPENVFKEFRSFVVAVARTVANPVRGDSSINWAHANAAAEFVSATGKFFMITPPKLPVDAVWELLAFTSCATHSSKTPYRRINWYGMLVRVAIQQSVVDRAWPVAHSAMRHNADLSKEVHTQILAMQRSGAFGTAIIAAARNEMNMKPIEEEEGEEGPLDGTNMDVSLDPDADWMKLMMSDPAEEIFSLSPELEQAMEALKDVNTLSLFAVEEPLEPSTPPMLAKRRPPVTLADFYKVTVHKHLPAAVDLTIGKSRGATVPKRPPASGRGKKRVCFDVPTAPPPAKVQARAITADELLMCSEPPLGCAYGDESLDTKFVSYKNVSNVPIRYVHTAVPITLDGGWVPHIYERALAAHCNC